MADMARRRARVMRTGFVVSCAVAAALSQAAVAQQQVGLSQRLDHIDKWGKILTIIAVVYGLILASVYFYQSWVASSSIGV